MASLNVLSQKIVASVTVTDTHRPHGGARSSSWRDACGYRWGEERKEKQERRTPRSRGVFCFFLFSPKSTKADVFWVK